MKTIKENNLKEFDQFVIYTRKKVAKYLNKDLPPKNRQLPPKNRMNFLRF